MGNELELMKLLLTSSVIVSATTIIGNVVMFMLNRKATKEDRDESKHDKVQSLEDRLGKLERRHEEDSTVLNEAIVSINKSMNDIKDGQRVILYDRILYLSRSFIHEGKISYEDKANLHKMHSVYHNQLNGNGDLDSAMKDVDELDTQY